MYVFTGTKSSQIAITTMQSFFVILNITGNSLVCVIIMKNQDMRYVFKLRPANSFLRKTIVTTDLEL